MADNEDDICGCLDAPSTTKAEYIKAVFEEGGRLIIPNRTVELTREGGHIEMEVHEPQYFQKLEQLYGSRRPKVAPLDVEDEQEVAMNAQVSLGVQYTDVWQRRGPEHISCYFDSDPIFC